MVQLVMFSEPITMGRSMKPAYSLVEPIRTHTGGGSRVSTCTGEILMPELWKTQRKGDWTLGGTKQYIFFSRLKIRRLRQFSKCHKMINSNTISINSVRF